MKMRFMILQLVFIVMPALVQAAEEAVVATVTERAEHLRKLGPVGSNITSNKQQYQILSGVRAAELQTDEQPQQALTRMGGDKMIETKGTFILFSAQQSAASVTSVNGTSYPAAYNTRTGGIGIVPGTLNVKLKNMSTANAVAAAYNLEVVRVFAHLQTAFYRVKTGQDVVSAAASLSADARVESAEVEVIEHLNVPH